MKRWIIALVVVVAVAGAAAAGWWYVNENPEWLTWFQEVMDQAVVDLGLEPEEEPPGLVASGFVEAEEASVTTEMGGRIVALYADEGDEVAEGEVIAQLDDSLLQSRIVMAEAELGVAEAMLTQVQAGVRQETLDHARAQLHQALAARDAARVAWDDAQAMLDNPQELELALTAARAQLGVLDYQTQQVEALANSAQVGREFADESMRLIEAFEPRDEWYQVGKFSLGQVPPEIPIPPDLGDGEYYFGKYKVVVEGSTVSVYMKVHIKVPTDIEQTARHEQAAATYQSWQAWTGLAEAKTARSGLESYLKELVQQRKEPLVLQAQANAAESQFEIAAAGVGLAKAQLDAMEIGATPEQVAAVEAQVGIAQAALEALQVQSEMFTLTAPISGLVLERPVHEGEVALPGAPLLTMADLENLTLTVYVPEDQLGQVHIGQPVSVTVDAYPDRVFAGTVRFVAGQAEFTPKNIQTREERVNMVFAVKVALPNPDHALKPGMPADAVLLEKE